MRMVARLASVTMCTSVSVMLVVSSASPHTRKRFLCLLLVQQRVVIHALLHQLHHGAAVRLLFVIDFLEVGAQEVSERKEVFDLARRGRSRSSRWNGCSPRLHRLHSFVSSRPAARARNASLIRRHRVRPDELTLNVLHALPLVLVAVAPIARPLVDTG